MMLGKETRTTQGCRRDIAISTGLSATSRSYTWKTWQNIRTKARAKSLAQAPAKER